MARGMAKLLYIVICIHIYMTIYIYMCEQTKRFQSPQHGHLRTALGHRPLHVL